MGKITCKYAGKDIFRRQVSEAEKFDHPRLILPDGIYNEILRTLRDGKCDERMRLAEKLEVIRTIGERSRTRLVIRNKSE